MRNSVREHAYRVAAARGDWHTKHLRMGGGEGEALADDVDEQETHAAGDMVDAGIASVSHSS